MADTVLIFAAHPDDEVLGVGGVAALHAARGDVVEVLIAAEGSTSRDPQADPIVAKEEVSQLQRAANTAARILGTRPPRFLGLPDNRMDGLDLLDIVKLFEPFVDALGPQIVYTHHPQDLNVDHEILSRAVLTACRPQPGCSVRAIYTFETQSSTEWSASTAGFAPSRFVDISSTLELKMQALDAYAGEMRAFPHARSLDAIRALAAWRGATVGMRAAEAFGVVRELVS